MNNRAGSATGLAFDGVAARRGPVPAFEFHLDRSADTRAWQRVEKVGQAPRDLAKMSAFPAIARSQSRFFNGLLAARTR